MLEDPAAITQPPLRVATMAVCSEKEWNQEEAIKEVLDICAGIGYYPRPDVWQELNTLERIRFPLVAERLRQLKVVKRDMYESYFKVAISMAKNYPIDTE